MNTEKGKIIRITLVITAAKEENKSRNYLQVFMKYTARHVRKFLEEGKIDPNLWKSHFPLLLESKVPACEDCDDFKSHLCQGGKEPVECFLAIELSRDKAAGDESTKKHVRKKLKKNQWSRKDQDILIPSGANKTFDQSKM